MFMRIFSGFIIILIGSLLSACQPPASGHSPGLSYPYVLWTLQKTPLEPQLNMPVEGVSSKQIQDTWGASRSEGRKHEGIDIFAKRGTPVLSATSGIVLDVGHNQLGGRVIWVLGPASSRHYYAHLEAYAPDIQTGDWVEVGKVLGFVGNTGNAKNTPPHLHYGIYLKNQGAVNPYPYLVEN